MISLHRCVVLLYSSVVLIAAKLYIAYSHKKCFILKTFYISVSWKHVDQVILLHSGRWFIGEGQHNQHNFDSKLVPLWQCHSDVYPLIFATLYCPTTYFTSLVTVWIPNYILVHPCLFILKLICMYLCQTLYTKPSLLRTADLYSATNFLLSKNYVQFSSVWLLT